MRNYGYNFFLADKSNEELVILTFPITPEELTIKVGSNNQKITLIDEGDINILKSPSLIEVEFDARFPMRQYPYARKFSDFQTYYDKFKELKENKQPFRFIVTRTTPSGVPTWDTNLLMALETFDIKESAKEGDDVIVSFKLKQFKEYGLVKISSSGNSVSYSASIPQSTSTSNVPRSSDNKGTTSSVYTVQDGDCLWNIAKAAYGDGSKYKTIYTANQDAIEADAKKHGKKSSSYGHWIWAGLKLTIPGISNASSLKVTKLW